MTKLEYGDFYKFLASLGLVITGLGVFLPWFLVTYAIVPQISQAEIDSLDESSRTLLRHKQELFSFLIENVWIALLIIFLGGVLTVFGLLKWWSKQRIADQHDFVKRKIDEKTLQQMTQSEIQGKALKEAEADIETEDQKEVPDPNLEELVEQDEKIDASIGLRYKYLGIDFKIADKLTECLPDGARLWRNRKIQNAQFDIVLDFPKQQFPNAIVEVKYIKKGFKFNWLQEIVTKLILMTQIYSDNVSRITNGILIIVVADMNQRFANYQYYYQKIIKDLPDNISVCFLVEDEIDTFPCAGLFEKMLAGGFLQR